MWWNVDGFPVNGDVRLFDSEALSEAYFVEGLRFCKKSIRCRSYRSSLFRVSMLGQELLEKRQWCRSLFQQECPDVASGGVNDKEVAGVAIMACDDSLFWRCSCGNYFF